MRRETAAAYLDMSEVEFSSGVANGHFPGGAAIGNAIRWDRHAIDAAIDAGSAEPEEDWRPLSKLYSEEPVGRTSGNKQARERLAERTGALNRPYSISSLAERWGCSTTLIRNMINRGEVSAFRYGKLYRIPAAEVERIEQNEVNR